MRLRYIFRRCWCQHLNCACEIDYCKNYEHEGMLRLRLIAERQKKPEPRMTDAHTNLPRPKHGEKQAHALVCTNVRYDGRFRIRCRSAPYQSYLHILVGKKTRCSDCPKLTPRPNWQDPAPYSEISSCEIIAELIDAREVVTNVLLT